MKYRIVEAIEGFYAQEKQCFLFKWKYVDNLLPQYTWKNNKIQSIVATYDEALKVVENRKQYLKDKNRKQYLNDKNFKKIHNL
jgi:hypothetical protein